MDVLLDAYESRRPDRGHPRTAVLHHARQFPVAAEPRALQASWASCADVQPAWLYKDGAHAC